MEEINLEDGLDHEIEKLLDRRGKLFMAYGWPYNAYERNSATELQEVKIKLFKQWIEDHYEKRQS